jgi:hypothetical protein
MAGTTKAKNSKQKTRTIAELTKFVWEHGKEKPLNPPLSINLGFDGAVPAKAIRYKSKDTPDDRERTFHVVYHQTDDGQNEPFALSWGWTKVMIAGETKSIDGMDFRTSLDGTLQNVVHAKGIVGEIEQTQLPIDSEDVLSGFKEIKQFFLTKPLPSNK